MRFIFFTYKDSAKREHEKCKSFGFSFFTPSCSLSLQKAVRTVSIHQSFIITFWSIFIIPPSPISQAPSERDRCSSRRKHPSQKDGSGFARKQNACLGKRSGFARQAQRLLWKSKGFVSIAKPLNWQNEALCQHGKTTKLGKGRALSA